MVSRVGRLVSAGQMGAATAGAVATQAAMAASAATFARHLVCTDEPCPWQTVPTAAAAACQLHCATAASAASAASGANFAKTMVFMVAAAAVRTGVAVSFASRALFAKLFKR